MTWHPARLALAALLLSVACMAVAGDLTAPRAPAAGGLSGSPNAGGVGVIPAADALSSPARSVGLAHAEPIGPPVALRAHLPTELRDAETARRNGEYECAGRLLRTLAGHQDASIANEAQLQAAVTMIDAGRFDAAAADARELLGRPIDGPTRAAGLTVLGRAQKAAGVCDGASGSFREAQAAGSPIPGALDLLIAECAAARNDRPTQLDQARKALDGAEARLAKVDALEHAVSAARKLNDLEQALRATEHLVSLAGTRAYRAQALLSLGTLQAELGQRDAAATSYATVVAELPDTPSATEALNGLGRLDALNRVALDQAAAVPHFAGRHGEAVGGLRAALDAGLATERAARARFYLGVSLLRLGRTDEAVAALRKVADDLPGSDLAARALLRAGRGLAADERLTDASELLRLAADALPSSAASQEAHAELAYTLLMRRAHPEAQATARELADREADGTWKGLGLLWASKALGRAGDRDGATALLRQAADADKDGFGGLRAGAILNGDAGAMHAPRPLDLARLQPTADDLAGIEAWLGGRGLGLVALDAEQATDPAYVRANHLHRVGLREWGGWELQDLAARHESDPARLYGLARFAADRGEAGLGMRFALAAHRAAGGALASQPRLLQRLVYPLPFAEVIGREAGKRNVDPLLMAGLMRQESAFNPTAKSSAGALGLGQVMPATGQGIANALGQSSFTTDDLLRPNVSIEFGAYYLASQLRQYGGQVYPALAAYNAGGGNVNGWLREISTEDMDLFAANVPFAETQYYIRVVYENYRAYHRLYAQ